jgi:hypothetical protein
MSAWSWPLIGIGAALLLYSLVVLWMVTLGRRGDAGAPRSSPTASCSSPGSRATRASLAAASCSC